MKRMIAAIAVAALAVTASAQTNQVLSRNAVGYQRIDLPANAFEFAANQFNMLDGSILTVSNILPSVSNGTQLILWDQSGQVYKTLLFNKGSWGAGGTNRVPRSDGFFLKGPASASQAIFLMGEVPDRLTATQTVSTVIQGFNTKAVAYPVSTVWTSTALAQALGNGDQFIVWDTTITNYTTLVKGKGTWGATNRYTLRPGQGFFVNKATAGSVIWTDVKPYTWP